MRDIFRTVRILREMTKKKSKVSAAYAAKTKELALMKKRSDHVIVFDAEKLKLSKKRTPAQKKADASLGVESRLSALERRSDAIEDHQRMILHHVADHLGVNSAAKSAVYRLL